MRTGILKGSASIGRAEPRRAALLRALALQLALAGLVLAATWAGFQTGVPVRAPAILSLPGLASGLNDLEEGERGPFRWTDGAATICAAQAGWAARSVVEVALAGDYALALGTAEVTIRPNANPAPALSLPPELRRYRLLTGGDQQPGPDLCVSLVGAAARDPNNDRSLGVPFYGASFRHLPAAGPVLPAPGQVGLNLIAAFVALWLIRLLGAPLWAAASFVGGATLLIGAALASGLVPAGAGLFGYMLVVVGGALGALAGLLAVGAISRRAPGLPLLARDLLGMAFWSALLVGGVRALQLVNGHQGAWPLKAGVDPHFTPLVILPAAICAGWAWLTLWLQERWGQADGPAPGPNRWGALLAPALVLIGAVLIPVALEAAVLGWESIYAVFRDNPYEYLADVPRVGDDPLGFVARYSDIAGELALHTRTHPPGAVLLLWAVERLVGPGPEIASWAAILLSALSALAALWLGWRLGGPGLAVLAGLIYVLMPGHMVYSVTSMDGLFNGLNALGAVAFFLCLEPAARARSALLAGALIGLGVFFTYTTTQLFFFGLAAAALAIYRGAAAGQTASAAVHVLRQGAIAAGTVVAIHLAIFLLTGFNIVQAAREATAENAIIAGKQLIEGPVRYPFLPPSAAHYVDFLGANLTPFLWYLAPWGLTALAAATLAGAGRGWAGLDRYEALLISAGVCVLGMWLAGLFNREVERIWGFAYPLLAVLIARHALQGDLRTRRWRAGLYLALFFAMSATIKMLLNTAW